MHAFALEIGKGAILWQFGGAFFYIVLHILAEGISIVAVQFPGWVQK